MEGLAVPAPLPTGYEPVLDAVLPIAVLALAEADAGWVCAWVVGWSLEMLGWRNPARPERIRRCVDVIARYIDHSLDVRA